MMENSQEAPASSTIQPMLTVSDVGALLHMKPATVRRYANLRKIPGAVRVGHGFLFRRKDIQRFVDGK
jgi:hypothetical protein